MDLKDICIEIAKKYNIDSIGLFGSTQSRYYISFGKWRNNRTVWNFNRLYQ